MRMGPKKSAEDRREDSLELSFTQELPVTLRNYTAQSFRSTILQIDKLLQSPLENANAINLIILKLDHISACDIAHHEIHGSLKTISSKNFGIFESALERIQTALELDRELR